MFGREKKEEEAKWLLMLFREGRKYWYKWLGLDNNGQLSELDCIKHDFCIDAFNTQPHSEPYGYWGDNGFKVKVSEDRLKEILKGKHPEGELQGELDITEKQLSEV